MNPNQYPIESMQQIAALRTLLDLATVQLNQAPPTYYVVVIPDTGDHTVMAFLTVQDAADYLKTTTVRDAKFRVFAGFRCPITMAPTRHLITPEGKFPLFDLIPEDEIDESGLLLDQSPPALPAGPPVDLNAPEPETEDDDGDEDEDDDEDDGDEEA